MSEFGWWDERRMPKDWRVAVLWGAVVVFAAWILWWASAGYPLDGPICLDEITKENCPRFNVIVYSLWRFAELVSHWAALILLYTDSFNTVGWTAFCHRYPCDMFGVAGHSEPINSRAQNRSIDREFARYHEEAGNDAG